MRYLQTRSVLIALMMLAVAAVPVPGATLRDLSGFSLGVLGANDDGSQPNIAIAGAPGSFSEPLNFYGVSLSVLNLNNNGNFMFGSGHAMSTYTPFGLTANIGQPVIAPFFADVDTRGSGSGLARYGWGTIDGRKAFAGDWSDAGGVGYYGYHTEKRNQFQAFLIDRSDTGSGNFDIEFDYNKIQWETGDASGGAGGFGGSPAHAGYSNGTGGGHLFRDPRRGRERSIPR